MTIGGRFLVVEDDVASSELLRQELNAVDIEAAQIANGLQAISLLKTEKFDAVFLELDLAVSDGIALARQMRSAGINRRTPLVAISGGKTNGSMAAAFGAGANFVLFKPVNRTQLASLAHIIKGPVEQERRRFRRVKVRRKVTILSGSDVSNGTTLDLSLNGMMVQCDQTFPVGTILSLAIELMPGSSPVSAKARVARLAAAGFMALEIEDGSATEREKIMAFLLPMIST
jgi:CheY-like chemotaxis protein